MTARKVIDRDTSQGHLTGDLAQDDEPTIRLFLNGDQIEEGEPSPIPSNYEDQVPDHFTHIIGQVPLTEEEVQPYYDAEEKYKAEREARGKRLAKEQPSAKVGLTRTQGIGWHLVDTGHLDDALVRHISDHVEAAGKELDVPRTWEGFGVLETTVREIISAAGSRRARRESEGEAMEDTYRDPRHESNCGARYSASATCECREA